MTDIAPPATRARSSKGRQTRRAIEDAARNLFAERGFHGTTLADITAAAGRSTAVFYQYFDDKEDLLAALADSFLRSVRQSAAPNAQPPGPAGDGDYFTRAVKSYWGMFKQHIGIMVAVDQLAATQARFAYVQNEFRRFGMDIVADSVRRAQQQGHAAGLDPEHTALAIALLFEQFTTVCLRPDPGGLGTRLSDTEAVATLAAIWKRTLYCPDGGANKEE